jgi:hypothetical protein
MIEPPRDTIPVPAPRGQRHVAQQHAGVDRHVVDALLGLLDDVSRIDLPGELLGPPPTFSSAW